MQLFMCLNRLKGRGVISDFLMSGVDYHPIPKIIRLTLIGAALKPNRSAIERELRQHFSGEIAFA